jgi:hypothetical protein
LQFLAAVAADFGEGAMDSVNGVDRDVPPLFTNGAKDREESIAVANAIGHVKQALFFGRKRG